MTTLHEEPPHSQQRTLVEEPEDSYSDPEYNETFEEEKTAQKYRIRSRLPSSKTMGSLMEIGNSHSNMSPYSSNTTTTSKHIVGTPSMSSSASSGYGSQV